MSPAKPRMSVATQFAAVVVLISLAAAASGRLWDLFGSADLGDVDFATLVRRASPNDALACPKGHCTAANDLESPEFAVDVRALRQALAAAMVSEWRLQRVGTDERSGRDRYIQRSMLLGFPDTIVVQFMELPGGRSALALYSRSKLGYGDFGANRARIDRWLGKLAAEIGHGR